MNRWFQVPHSGDRLKKLIIAYKLQLRHAQLQLSTRCIVNHFLFV